MKRLLVCVFLACTAYGQSTIAGCPSFPANNIWNTAVDSLPVHSQSGDFIAKIGPTAGLRVDDTLPINIATRADPKMTIIGIGTPESDAGVYTVPAKSQVEGGSDAHVIVVDRSDCILYELFLAKFVGGRWTANSAAKWDLNSNALRPDGWTSADAAGLPMMPGILRYEEIAAGQVNHALRMTAPYTKGNGAYQWPARHYASHHPDGPPMGQRFRLKASVNISGFSPTVQTILRGLKKYGAMLADNGIPWGMQHDQDPRWSGQDLLALHQVLGSEMEAVDVSALMTTSELGSAGSIANAIMARDALGRSNPIKLGQGLSIVNGVLVVAH